jgi:hypothetical protein
VAAVPARAKCWPLFLDRAIGSPSVLIIARVAQFSLLGGGGALCVLESCTRGIDALAALCETRSRAWTTS